MTSDQAPKPQIASVILRMQHASIVSVLIALIFWYSSRLLMSCKGTAARQTRGSLNIDVMKSGMSASLLYRYATGQASGMAIRKSASPKAEANQKTL